MNIASEKISVVITVFNEEENIHELVSRLQAEFRRDSREYEIIFLENGSTDSTAVLIEQERKDDAGVKMIQLSRNFVHPLSVRTGLRFITGDIVIIMDGDLQDLPEEIPKLLKPLQDGYDIAYAQRLNRQDIFLRRFGALVIRKMLVVLSRGNNEMPAGDERMWSGTFHAMTRKVADALNALPEHTPHLHALIRWIGFRSCVVGVTHGKRHAGSSKYTLRTLAAHAIDGVTAISFYPLRFLVSIGALCVVLAKICALIFIAWRFLYGVWPSNILALGIVVFFFFGVQLFIFGILGEYMGRILAETKQRPHTIIKKTLI